MGSFIELTRGLLILLSGGLFLLFSWLAFEAAVKGDVEALVPQCFFALVFASVAFAAYRRLKGSIRSRKLVESKQEGPRDWKGDPML